MVGARDVSGKGENRKEKVSCCCWLFVHFCSLSQWFIVRTIQATAAAAARRRARKLVSSLIVNWTVEQLLLFLRLNSFTVHLCVHSSFFLLFNSFCSLACYFHYVLRFQAHVYYVNASCQLSHQIEKLFSHGDKLSWARNGSWNKTTANEKEKKTEKWMNKMM